MPRAKKVKQEVESAELLEDAVSVKRDRGEIIQVKEEGLASILRTSGDDVVEMYDTQTGQKSLTLKYMLPAQLKKKRADGSRVFTVHDPKIPQKVGAFTCLLHPDREERKHFDELGLAVCNKSNLVSEYHMNRHVQKKHKDEWNVIQAEIKKKEKEEEQKFQHSLLERVSK